ncbi:YveK family protein [Alkalibacterium pelagium]|uniref:Capsular polysaccharide biosynthesis protein CpsC n=1 Tax=Alkalibacterium pelagium TaxID=426702 RepID=A0A1H7HVF5_9LACT|nr:Wzz/FepE/Etk N-terminal domain-containing protein [Alkalibacterium pelagium]GEN50385.1 tyrosine protein kinase [Alkalibacterium pelagium]SEK52205.1 Capsular polysaccharide biosynthesis protein [Alkalibacterium pelagium]
MEEISLIEFLKIFKTYAKLIFVFVIMWTGLISGLTFFVVSPQYRSSAQILVNRVQDEQTIQSSDIETNVQLINTFKDILVSPVILDEVLQQLGSEMTSVDLARKITVSNQFNSQLFTLEVRDTSPQQAAVLANTVAETFQSNVGEIMNVENVSIISSAAPNYTPVSPNKPLSVIMGVIIGLGTGVGTAFVLFFMDHTVKSDKFISEKMKWKVLGQIEEVSMKELIMLEKEKSVEEIRTPSIVKGKT